MPFPVTVAILAGGRSRRMGRPKAWLDVQGRPLLTRVLASVRELSQDILLIANQPELYTAFDLPCLPDLIPDSGPLGGLYTALKAARQPWTLVVACDMPWLNPALLAALIELALSSAEEAVVPRWDERPEPLHAVYHRRCLPALTAKIKAGDLKIAGLLNELSVRYVEPAEIRRYDADGRSFTNLNTPDDWAASNQRPA